ncbi:hypothetical protein GE09DRAFT_1144867 [Coniochaeta sp. 2T2.1]|nr:hypothetical protein GE09DRAFT_1144867 [Coniochaeta sp. 2T2.1]
MPIIIHTADPTLANIPFDTDENRTVLANALPSRKLLGAGICAIIHKDVPVANKADFKIHPKTPTLDTAIRNQVALEIKEKKNSLVKTYPDAYGVVDGRAELDKLRWPNTRDAKFTELIKQFKPPKCAAMGTGFHVGNNLVITAAHCVEDLGPFNLGEYRLVFNFTGDDLPAVSVFSIRRIVHYNSRHSAPGDPGAPIFPRFTYLPPNSKLVDLAAMVEDAETYDVAVLELIGASSAQPQPKALVLQPTLAVKGTDVYSIGCSSGMPFIYAHGSKGRKADPLAGTVRKLPDAGNFPRASSFVSHVCSYAV